MNNTCCILNSAITVKLFVFPVTNRNIQLNTVGLSKSISCFTPRHLKAWVQSEHLLGLHFLGAANWGVEVSQLPEMLWSYPDTGIEHNLSTCCRQLACTMSQKAIFQHSPWRVLPQDHKEPFGSLDSLFRSQHLITQSSSVSGLAPEEANEAFFSNVPEFSITRSQIYKMNLTGKTTSASTAQPLNEIDGHFRIKNRVKSCCQPNYCTYCTDSKCVAKEKEGQEEVVPLT